MTALRFKVPVKESDEAVFTMRLPLMVTLTPDILNGWPELGMEREDARTLRVAETECDNEPSVPINVIA